jgi:hypothetical protein
MVTLASSSRETLNYVAWLVRWSLQHEGGTLSFVPVVSFGCQVGEPRLWITSCTRFRNHAPQRTGILISKCNLSFLPHRTVFFIFVLLKYEAHKIALICQI